MARTEHTCLVLGGGGIRGLAHLGVLQVLEDDGISVDCMVGTSVGAIVGSSYALHPDARAVAARSLARLRSDAFAGNAFKKMLLRANDAEHNFLSTVMVNLRRGILFNHLLRKESIFPGEKLYEVIEDLVPDRTFADIEIPFAIPALDIRGGEDVLLTEGSLRRAAFASCALPGFFPPVEMGEMLLADAGVIGPVPVHAARRHFRPKALIAVDISSDVPKLDRVERGLDAILRVEALACARLNAAELESADVVVRPQVGDQEWSDFSGFESLIAAGVAAAKDRLPEIRAVVRRGLFRRLFRHSG